MIAYIAILIALAGLLMYILASNPKVVELGRLLFFCGSLAVTLQLAGKTFRVF
jgi:Na+/phosphate symporter